MTGSYRPGMTRREKWMLRAALVIAFLALLTVAFAAVGTECSLSSIRADSSCSVGDDDTILNDLVIRSGTAFDLTQSHNITANRNPTWPDAAGVVVLDSNTQTVSGKTFTSPGITGSPTAAGATWTDLGTVSTAVINGGTITGITDLAVADGGTGAGTFTDHGVIVGSGTGALSVTATGSSGEVLTSNGSGADPTFQTGGGIVPLTAVKTADETITSSTTQQDDDHLFLAVEANKRYRVFLWLETFRGVTTNTLKVQLTLPSGATSRLGETSANTCAQNNPCFTLSLTQNTQGYLLQGRITIASTAGNVQVQWAPGSNVAEPVSVFTGSWLEVYEVSN